MTKGKSKAFGQRTMEQAVKDRYGQPILSKTDGKPSIGCPFCKPSHPLNVDGVSPCGTFLQLRAVQTVYKGRMYKDMVCLKCQKGGGEFVHFNAGYIHTHDCMPGVFTFLEQPPFSALAKIVHGLPDGLKKRAETWLGQTMTVDEVTPEGVRTGKKLGYFFHKKA